MNDVVRLASEQDGVDLQTFLARAFRLGCEHVRLQMLERHLVATVAVLEKQGLLDAHPDVLAVRVWDLGTPGDHVDSVYLVRGVLDRLAKETIQFALPVAQPGIAWAGRTPPASDWIPAGSIPVATLETVARAGIDEVAATNGLGAKVVDEVRRRTWGRAIKNADSSTPIVAGMAFASLGMGFLGQVEGEAKVTTNGPWTRLSTPRGEILSR